MPPVRSLLPSTVVLLVPALAFGQAGAGTGAPAATPAATGASGAQPGGAPAAAAAQQGQPDAPKAPTVPATGYGYDDGPRRRAGPAAPRRVATRASGPVATLPGFELLADGGSRLFVQLTQTVPVEEKRAGGTVTYVLKGAHVTKYNNERPLVTVHFNTPVSRARLIPSGKDLHFIVDLRANVQPTWKMETAKDSTAILAIDFPKGDFLPTGPSAPADDAEDKPAPAPRRATKKKG